MICSNVKKEFSCDINELWNIITDNSKYIWRTDLFKIEIIDESHFIEYTKSKYPTYFLLLKKIGSKYMHLI